VSPEGGLHGRLYGERRGETSGLALFRHVDGMEGMGGPGVGGASAIVAPKSWFESLTRG
jgi:hypothetical protein